MLSHTRMGVPYEYTHNYGTSHTHAYGPIYAYAVEHRYYYLRSYDTEL